VKHKCKKTIAALSVIIGLLALQQSAYSQTARVALDTYEEGPVWKLAVEKKVLVDYKVLTKWSSSPDDWNIMVVEIFPNMASYDTFWEDWAAIDTETVDTPKFQERMAQMESTGTQFLGTVFAREVRLKPQ
jgi:hypothetical protein